MYPYNILIEVLLTHNRYRLQTMTILHHTFSLTTQVVPIADKHEKTTGDHGNLLATKH